MKKSTKPDELRKLFTDHCGRERHLRVSLELPHREEVPNEEEQRQYRDALVSLYLELSFFSFTFLCTLVCELLKISTLVAL
jgi:hypothetical protein